MSIWYGMSRPATPPHPTRTLPVESVLLLASGL